MIPSQSPKLGNKEPEYNHLWTASNVNEARSVFKSTQRLLNNYNYWKIKL